MSSTETLSAIAIPPMMGQAHRTPEYVRPVERGAISERPEVDLYLDYVIDTSELPVADQQDALVKSISEPLSRDMAYRQDTSGSGDMLTATSGEGVTKVWGIISRPHLALSALSRSSHRPAQDIVIPNLERQVGRHLVIRAEDLDPRQLDNLDEAFTPHGQNWLGRNGFDSWVSKDGALMAAHRGKFIARVSSDLTPTQQMNALQKAVDHHNKSVDDVFNEAAEMIAEPQPTSTADALEAQPANLNSKREYRVSRIATFVAGLAALAGVTGSFAGNTHLEVEHRTTVPIASAPRTGRVNWLDGLGIARKQAKTAQPTHQKRVVLHDQQVSGTNDTITLKPDGATAVRLDPNGNPWTAIGDALRARHEDHGAMAIAVTEARLGITDFQARHMLPGTEIILPKA